MHHSFPLAQPLSFRWSIVILILQRGTQRPRKGEGRTKSPTGVSNRPGTRSIHNSRGELRQRLCGFIGWKASFQPLQGEVAAGFPSGAWGSRAATRWESERMGAVRQRDEPTGPTGPTWRRRPGGPRQGRPSTWEGVFQLRGNEEGAHREGPGCPVPRAWLPASSYGMNAS